jgi:TolB-like protein/tetratricopeptide (TPR) repeat protein
MKLGNFFAELKRRNVYKVAVAYAVVSWLLIQAASILLPTFEAPAWVMKVLVLVIIFGFPVALIVSWAFEITSEGIKLESEIEPNKSIARRTGRKIVAVTIALAVVAAGLFVYQLVRSKSDTPRQDASAARTVAAKAAPSKSIAVLPFDNLSRDPDNAYFCEGVQDEILTRLAKVGDLKVISRTSTQHFKSAPENLPEIARQLGVANILEGSVQRSGDQVRVNVQLIKAGTDAHLWADTFDRKLTDIFAVESDIAKTIADTLQAKLTGSEQTAISKTPTANPQAYELYLKGRFFWNKRTGVDLKKAAEFFQQAILADPNYASAYAGLAQTQLLIPVFGAGKPPDFFPAATSAARRAIALDETSAEGHSALAMLLLFDSKFAESEKEFQRAIDANPNYATAHHWLGNSLLVTLGRFDEGVKEGKRAVELDPLSLIINADLGSTFMIARRYDDAIGQFKRTLALDDKFSYARWNLGEALYLKGDTKAAIAEYEKARALDDDPQILALLGRAYAETGRRAEALELLARLQEKGKGGYVRSCLYTVIYIGLGDRSAAIDYLEKAREGEETPDTLWIKVDPLFDPLRGEPRFQQLVARLFARSP